jgi:hypothetical protein
MAAPRAALDPGAVCLPDFSDYFLKMGMVDNGSGALQVIKRPDNITCTNVYMETRFVFDSLAKGASNGRCA